MGRLLKVVSESSLLNPHSCYVITGQKSDPTLDPTYNKSVRLLPYFMH